MVGACCLVKGLLFGEGVVAVLCPVKGLWSGDGGYLLSGEGVVAAGGDLVGE